MQGASGFKVPSGKHDAAADAAAAVTIAADASQVHVVTHVFWSYEGGTPTGNLQISIGGTVLFNHDIVAAGPGSFSFGEGLSSGVANEAVVVTLAAGGSGVTGKLTVLYR